MSGGVTLTVANYPNLWRLATGDVQPAGVTLNLERGPRDVMLTRALNDPKVDGGEGSLAEHLRRVDSGDRSQVGLPVFVLRNFCVRDLYVRKGGDIDSPGRLVGKRIGMYRWAASGSVWYRHTLRWLGVPLDGIEWTIGPIDEAGPSGPNPGLPSRVKPAPENRFLTDMLAAGELDAIYTPAIPRGFDPTLGPLVRLVPDFRSVEEAYYRQTRCYPAQHIVIIHRSAWEARPWIGGKLLAAFSLAKQQFHADVRMFPYSTPWQLTDLEATIELMGDDYDAHGLGPNNRKMLSTFCNEAYQAGLTRRRVQVEELFDDFLLTDGAPAQRKGEL